MSKIKTIDRDMALKFINASTDAWYGVGPKLSRDDVQAILRRLYTRIEGLETWEVETDA